jgi:cellulose synthase/poly-beta-1,6-N-acetylglucosamine synthase-like glycosyltransferase
MIVLLVWFIAYALSILFLVFGVQRLRLSVPTKVNQHIDQITVVVPFRNESKNLKHFLDSVYAQKYQPVQWIFVNDHSTDDYRSVFLEYKEFPIRVISLPEDQRGKKRAVRFGMDHATTDYCLTMDADVVFGSDYIKSLMVLPEADLVILPVEMTATKWWHGFFTLEYSFTTLINKGVTGWLRPVSCSGANLLIHVASFDEVDDIDDHDHVLSGDDMYTLRAFREAGKRVEVVESKELTVSTKTPERLSDVMNQRVRWMSKTGNVNDNLNSGLGIWAVLLHLVYLFLLIVTWFSGSEWFTLTIFVTKTALDFTLLHLNIQRWNATEIVGLLLFELLYPFYVLALFASMLFVQVEWKGR